MNMNINETWNDQMIMQFNDGKPFREEGRRIVNNTAFGNGNIHILKSSVQKNGSAGQQQIHGVLLSSCCFSTYDFIGKSGGCQRHFRSELYKKRAESRPAFGEFIEEPELSPGDTGDASPGTARTTGRPQAS